MSITRKQFSPAQMPYMCFAFYLIDWHKWCTKINDVRYSSNMHRVWAFVLLWLVFHFQIGPCDYHKGCCTGKGQSQTLWNNPRWFGKWASYHIRKIAGCACARNAGSVCPLPRVSDPDMHHGTCVMHVPWCMPGSLTRGFLLSRWRGKRSRHSRRLRNPHF